VCSTTLVLFLGEGRAVHRLAGVGVGDGLALDADLLTLHGNRAGLVLGDDVLAQSRRSGLARGGADAQLLLAACHRAVRAPLAGAGASPGIAARLPARRLEGDPVAAAHHLSVQH